ncbi:MAG TPA: TonB family protein [Rhizomicrobium sp.]|jgi:protein TonB|nr:TonB family protein [Rhizomicrobium sp.]
MEQPFHSQRAVPQGRFTPARIAGLAASLLLQAGFVYAIISGLAGQIISKLPEELKVAVEQEHIQPKPPPPPPPQVDLPPPPVAPPPEINIQTEAPVSPITVTNKPPPPPQPVHQAISTPVSVGRPHVCQQNYPEVSVRLNEEGTTLLSFKVMTDGSVSDVTVAKSSGYSRLDDAAVSCASRWHYKPQTVDGTPVVASWQANVQWKLH